jgi:acyl-CoA thioesterase FadM
MYLPGERAILEKIELQYRHPVYADRELTYSCTVARVRRALGRIQLTLTITVDGIVHVRGECQCLLR